MRNLDLLNKWSPASSLRLCKHNVFGIIFFFYFCCCQCGCNTSNRAWWMSLLLRCKHCCYPSSTLFVLMTMMETTKAVAQKFKYQILNRDSYVKTKNLSYGFSFIIGCFLHTKTFVCGRQGPLGTAWGVCFTEFLKYTVWMCLESSQKECWCRQNPSTREGGGHLAQLATVTANNQTL